MPGKESTEAIKYLAQREGLFVDPVYSGKALAALIAHVKSGKDPAGKLRRILAHRRCYRAVCGA